jgi:hypothetical protein
MQLKDVCAAFRFANFLFIFFFLWGLHTIDFELIFLAQARFKPNAWGMILYHLPKHRNMKFCRFSNSGTVLVNTWSYTLFRIRFYHLIAAAWQTSL